MHLDHPTASLDQQDPHTATHLTIVNKLQTCVFNFFAIGFYTRWLGIWSKVIHNFKDQNFSSQSIKSGTKAKPKTTLAQTGNV